MRLTAEYWDCECENNYIHSKYVKFCRSCLVYAEDMPNSRIEEVREYLDYGKPLTAYLYRLPVLDEKGVPVKVGDEVLVKHCVGPYGQTRTERAIVHGPAFHQHGQIGLLSVNGEYIAGPCRIAEYEGQEVALCSDEHRDFEHGHTKFIRVVAPAKNLEEEAV